MLALATSSVQSSPRGHLKYMYIDHNWNSIAKNTNSMELSDSHTAGQETAHLLWNPKFHYHIDNS